MPFLRNTPVLRYALITLFASLIWMYMSITSSAIGSAFVMPNLAEMIRLALEFGDIEAVVGQRHYTGAPVLQWDLHFSASHEIPVFHAYGFGGSGLTLAPSVAEYIASQIGEQVLSDHSPITDSSEIVIFGAGYIGIFTALEIRRFFNRHNKPHIPVRVVAQAYPKGITDIMPDKSEPTREDNSGIQTVNEVCPLNLYPEYPFHNTFVGWNYNGNAQNLLNFDQVVAFDNVIQTDTVSVLKYITEQLSTEGVELIQTEAMISFNNSSQPTKTPL